MMSDSIGRILVLAKILLEEAERIKPK